MHSTTPQAPRNSNWKTRSEIASWLRVSEKTIDRARRAGAPHLRVGTVVLFDPDRLVDWFGENPDWSKGRG